jgi:hypothetical protein
LRGRARSVAQSCARQPCKRRSPRQDRSAITVIAVRTADGSRSPEVEAASPARSTARLDPHTSAVVSPIARPVIPTKINRDARTERRERHVGPVGQKCHGHPDAGSNLRRANEPQERRRTRRKFEGRTCSSGKAARLPRDAGSGTPREEDASAHDPPGRRD